MAVSFTEAMPVPPPRFPESEAEHRCAGRAKAVPARAKPRRREASSGAMRYCFAGAGVAGVADGAFVAGVFVAGV
ncbi:MAG: hypothetical protein P8Y53_06150, partial [Pseudolabrys sp.]